MPACRSHAVRQARSLVRLAALLDRGLHMQPCSVFSAPFEVIVINSRISNRSLTDVFTEIYSTGL